ncbi:MAG: hypothetical protein FJ150_09275 [Euryarchaeota archaeon]|nr:hypothetical protein [Euryarchaeota archaeon]
MKKLGIISHISNKGNFIVRSKKTPGFKLTVFSKDKKRLGKIHDIFGPTKKPYISVKPQYTKNSENLGNRVGETLYVSAKHEKKWGRRKRRKK